MTKTVGFGLLGAGLIAPFHAEAITNLPEARLVAVADGRPERAAQVAEKFGARACGSLEELLDDPEIEVVNILTPNHLHYGPALQSLQAGRHVLTEKPAAMTLAELDEMVAAAGAAERHLGVVLQCRARAVVQAMREALQAGRFGRPLRADFQMKWFRGDEYYSSDAWRQERQSGAGVTIQHAFHYLDLLQYVMGPVRQVRAHMSNLAHPDFRLEDTVAAELVFANGAEGQVLASTALWPGQDLRLEIHGTAGSAVMVGERMALWKFRDEQPGDEAKRALGRAVQTAADNAAGFDIADHQTVIEAMARAVRGEGEPFITVAASRHTLEIALAMYQSADTDQAVTLPL